MDFGLAGKRAVVTGASAGIGLAVTRTLIAEGATVTAGALATSSELTEIGRAGSVEAVEVDLTTPDGPAQLIAAAGGPVDIVVNNLGLSVPRPDGFASVTDEQWLATLTMNLLAAVRTTRAALPAMLTAGAGSIVNIASTNAWLPDAHLPDYNAAKAALWNLAKALSKEVGGQGVRVNTVAPGPTATRRWRPEQTVEVAKRMVTGRLTDPDEVAVMVAFLAGGRAGNITGATVTVDGGLTPTI